MYRLVEAILLRGPLGRFYKIHRSTLDTGWCGLRIPTRWNLPAKLDGCAANDLGQLYDGNRPDMVFFTHAILENGDSELAMGRAQTVLVTESGPEMLNNYRLEPIVRN